VGIEAVAAGAAIATAVVGAIWALAKFSLTRLGTRRLSLRLELADVDSPDGVAGHLLTLHVHNVGARRFKPTVALVYPSTSQRGPTGKPLHSSGSVGTVLAPLHGTRRRSRVEGNPILDAVYERIRQR